MLNESIIDAFCTLDRSFAGRSHLVDTVVEFFTLQTQHHLFNSSRLVAEVNPNTRKKYVSTHASTSTQLESFIPIRPRLRSELLSPPPMQIDPLVGRYPESFPVSRPLMHAVQDELMARSLTAREMRRLLQKGANRPFIDHMSFTLFLRTRQLCEP